MATSSTDLQAKEQSSPPASKVEHIFDIDALRFAKELNISVQAFCGTWHNPKTGAPVVQLRNVSEIRAETCGRCVAIVIRDRSES